MISSRLKLIFGLSIPLFVAHGFEEYFTRIYDVDSQVQFALGFLKPFGSLQTRFMIYQIALWALLIVAYILVMKGIWQRPLLIFLGLLFVYDLQHIYDAFVTGGYYPGLATSLAFPFLAYFFWREWLKVYQKI